jgi:hypothetical protein
MRLITADCSDLATEGVKSSTTSSPIVLLFSATGGGLGYCLCTQSLHHFFHSLLRSHQLSTISTTGLPHSLATTSVSVMKCSSGHFFNPPSRLFRGLTIVCPSSCDCLGDMHVSLCSHSCDSSGASSLALVIACQPVCGLSNRLTHPKGCNTIIDSSGFLMRVFLVYACSSMRLVRFLSLFFFSWSKFLYMNE